MLTRRLLGLLAGFLACLSPAGAADIPRPAPDLVIPVTGGQQVKLSDYRGKVVALEFILTTCGHCQNTARIMSGLHQELGTRGFQPVGVAINDMAHMLVPDFIRDYRVSFPVGWGSRDTAVNFLQHPVMFRLMMPQLVLIDRQGVIRAQYGGGDKFFENEEKNLREIVLSLLKEPVSSGNKGAPKKAS